MQSLNVAIIGFGYWGPNIARNFASNAHVNVSWIIDGNPAALKKAAASYPATRLTTDWQEAVADPEVDIVAVVTPVATHYALCKAALENGKHVWVEKPMTATVAEAEELIALAERSGCLLHVDHTFVYTGAVRKLKELIDKGELGDELYYYDSTRINLGLFQKDVDVLWDLAVHDLGILTYLREENPHALSAHGMSHIKGRKANTAFLTMYYPSGFLAHINASWLSPIKVRQLLLAGNTKMAVYDDIEPTEKIRIYDKGLEVVSTPEDDYKIRVDYRTGDIVIPKISTREALSLEVEHFLECIDRGVPTLTNGHVGLRTVRLLELATESLGTMGAVKKCTW